MGSDGTATATTGGPRVIDVFYGNGRHRVQIVTFFSDIDRLSDSPPDRSGVGWSPTPHAAPVLGAPRELWIENFGGSWSRAIERKGPCLYVCTDGSRRACGVGACACKVTTSTDLREASGPRIDRIPPTRPPWWRRQYRDIKKLIFLTPSTCPIDVFGPVASRRILKQMHGVHIKSNKTGPQLLHFAFQVLLSLFLQYTHPQSPSTL